VTVSGPPNQTTVAWRLKGKWDKDPEASVSIFLQKVDADTGKARDIKRLAGGLSPDSRQVLVDLSACSGPSYRIVIRKDGDSETGGHSEPFEIE
jgi:hypothetical protein